MHVASFVLALIGAIWSVFVGCAGGVASFIGDKVSQVTPATDPAALAAQAELVKLASMAKYGGYLMMTAAIVALVGGIMAMAHKQKGMIVLLVAALLALITMFMGFGTSSLWAVLLYVAAAVCAYMDLKKGSIKS